MKRYLQLWAFLAILTLSFTACQKENSAVPSKDENETELSLQSDDQARVTSETDEVSDEINTAIEASPALQGRGAGVLCNATVAIDTLSNPRTITITYNGLNCIGNRSRTGVVTVSFPAGIRWKDAGAAITVNISNLKITRVSDGKFIILNGTKTITNVSGGRLKDLPTMGTIIHTVTSNNMSIQFDTSAHQRVWNIAKKRTFSFNAGSVVISTTGMHTIGSNNKVVEWGHNRFGNAFITSIEHPLTVKQSCNFRLTDGQVKHELLGRNLTVTFGLNAAGNPTTCPGANPYYMKLVWTGPGGISHTLIRPY